MSAVGATAALRRSRTPQHQLIVRASRWGYLEPGRPVPEGRCLTHGRPIARLWFRITMVLPRGRCAREHLTLAHPSKVAGRGLLYCGAAQGRAIVATISHYCESVAVKPSCGSITRLDPERQQRLIEELERRASNLQPYKSSKPFLFISHDLRVLCCATLSVLRICWSGHKARSSIRRANAHSSSHL